MSVSQCRKVVGMTLNMELKLVTKLLKAEENCSFRWSDLL